MKVAIFAVFCFSMLICVNCESTSEMRIRLHNLVEEYVAIHNFFSPPVRGIFNRAKLCANPKLSQKVKAWFNCPKKHLLLEDETPVHHFIGWRRAWKLRRSGEK